MWFIRSTNSFILHGAGFSRVKFGKAIAPTKAHTHKTSYKITPSITRRGCNRRLFIGVGLEGGSSWSAHAFSMCIFVYTKYTSPAHRIIPGSLKGELAEKATRGCEGKREGYWSAGINKNPVEFCSLGGYVSLPVSYAMADPFGNSSLVRLKYHSMHLQLLYLLLNLTGRSLILATD